MGHPVKRQTPTLLLPLPDLDTGIDAAVILIGVVDDGVLVAVERVLDAVVVGVPGEVDNAAVGVVVPGEVVVLEFHEGARRVDLRAVLAHSDCPCTGWSNWILHRKLNILFDR